MKSNCYIWSISQWIRHAGKISLKRSITWFGFHMTWTDVYGTEWEYTVKNPRKRSWWYIPFLYDGIVKKIDKSPKL